MGAPKSSASNYRGKPPAASAMKGRFKRPADFWLDDDTPALLGRLLPQHGRSAEYLAYYDAAFRSSDDVIELLKHRPIVFTLVASTISAVLRQADRTGDADTLTERAESMLEGWLHNGRRTGELLASLSRYRALGGKDDEVIALLNRAYADGWLPDGAFYPADLARSRLLHALRAGLISRPSGSDSSLGWTASGAR